MLESTKPNCFGEAWEPEAKECKGGLDAGYTDPTTGSHIRDPCECYEACGSHTQAMRLKDARQHSVQLITSQQLVRAQSAGTTTTMSKAQVPVLYPPPEAAVQQQKVAAGMQAPSINTAGYQPMAVNYSMPTYLTVPETRFDGESFFIYAIRVLVRAMLKGGAHGLAHLFDTTSLKK